MADISIDFFSNSLMRSVTFKMYIPNDFRADIPREETEYSKRKMKTLFLLHGYTDKAFNWMPTWVAEKYNFAVVMPSGENSFWLNGAATGRKFCTYVGDELVRYVRKTFGLAMSADETYIMGLSMGGFGALHAAFAYPDNFGKVTALSSALIVHQIAHMKEGENNGVANYDYYRSCFGDLDTVEQSDNNPEVLAERLHKSGRLPEIFMACGTEDFLLAENRQFHSFLDSIGAKHIYLESKGGHDMTFWNEYAIKFGEMMFG